MTDKTVTPVDEPDVVIVFATTDEKSAQRLGERLAESGARVLQLRQDEAPSAELRRQVSSADVTATIESGRATVLGRHLDPRESFGQTTFVLDETGMVAVVRLMLGWCRRLTTH